MFFGIIFYTLRSGAKVTQNNPWNEFADTLEWTLPSPPPEHTFEILPKQEEWDKSHRYPESMEEWAGTDHPTDAQYEK